jgi:hypothetical protein
MLVLTVSLFVSLGLISFINLSTLSEISKKDKSALLSERIVNDFEQQLNLMINTRNSALDYVSMLSSLSSDTYLIIDGPNGTLRIDEDGVFIKMVGSYMHSSDLLSKLRYIENQYKVFAFTKKPSGMTHMFVKELDGNVFTLDIDRQYNIDIDSIFQIPHSVYGFDKDYCETLNTGKQVWVVYYSGSRDINICNSFPVFFNDNVTVKGLVQTCLKRDLTNEFIIELVKENKRIVKGVAVFDDKSNVVAQSYGIEPPRNEDGEPMIINIEDGNTNTSILDDLYYLINIDEDSIIPVNKSYIKYTPIYDDEENMVYVLAVELDRWQIDKNYIIPLIIMCSVFGFVLLIEIVLVTPVGIYMHLVMSKLARQFGMAKKLEIEEIMDNKISQRILLFLGVDIKRIVQGFYDMAKRFAEFKTRLSPHIYEDSESDDNDESESGSNTDTISNSSISTQDSNFSGVISISSEKTEAVRNITIVCVYVKSSGEQTNDFYNKVMNKMNEMTTIGQTRVALFLDSQDQYLLVGFNVGRNPKNYSQTRLATKTLHYCLKLQEFIKQEKNSNNSDSLEYKIAFLHSKCQILNFGGNIRRTRKFSSTIIEKVKFLCSNSKSGRIVTGFDEARLCKKDYIFGINGIMSMQMSSCFKELEEKTRSYLCFFYDIKNSQGNTEWMYELRDKEADEEKTKSFELFDNFNVKGFLAKEEEESQMGNKFVFYVKNLLGKTKNNEIQTKEDLLCAIEVLKGKGKTSFVFAI